MKKRAFIIFLFGIHFILTGQTNIESSSFKSLPFENINLFTDRDLYISGETIWFSAEVSLDVNQKALSQVMYIELFNADQKSIVRKKYRINQGQSSGALDIPKEFLSDVYFLRAYTHYNKNFSSDNYFISAIQIINPRLGLNTKIESEQIKESELHLSDSYTIDPNFHSQKRRIISVITNSEHSEINDEIHTLELYNNKLELLSFARFSFTNKRIKIAIPDSIFSKPGLYFYTLKDEKNRILKAHAAIYTHNRNKLAKPKAHQRKFKKRESVGIDLNEFDTVGISNFGLKVVQKGTVLTTADKLDLYFDSPPLLFSYFKTGFNPLDLSSEEANIFIQKLNHKLNTNEFTDFLYPPKASELKWLPEIRDIGLSGVVVNKLTQEPIAKNHIYMAVFKEHPQIHIFESRENGSFQFSLNNFENYQEVFLCPIFENDNELELKINMDFSSNFPDLKAIPLSIDSTDIDLLEQMVIAYQTTKAYRITSKQQDFNISNLPYSFDNPQISVVLDDYIVTPTIEMVFKELVPSVYVKKRRDKYRLSVYDSEREISYDDPLILVDNVPILDVNELLKIAPRDIEKIEVHLTPFILGDHTINGIIMIRTLTDNFGGMIMPKSSAFFEYQTLSPTYNFMAKSYNAEDVNSRTADFRTLLHWDPSVQNKSKQQLKFYTSDQTGEYETFIFGTSKSGQTFHSKLFNFEIRD